MQTANPIVRQGSQGQSVKTLQQLLTAAGYPLNADGIFGPRTEAAVKKFQKDKGLVVDGIVGPKTWSSLIAANPILRQGSQGQSVKTLQQLLTAAGYPLTVDGIFGPRTEAAVKKFQQANRLTVDGIVGPKTWSSLIASAN